jgi:hypothetical protein
MHETMATDPSFMVDMMKKNLTGGQRNKAENFNTKKLKTLLQHECGLVRVGYMSC